MTLDEFIAESKKDIERFEADWRKHNAADPAMYPAELQPGDWFENFMVFLTMEESNNDGDVIYE